MSEECPFKGESRTWVYCRGISVAGTKITRFCDNKPQYTCLFKEENKDTP